MGDFYLGFRVFCDRHGFVVCPVSARDKLALLPRVCTRADPSKL